MNGFSKVLKFSILKDLKSILFNEITNFLSVSLTTVVTAERSISKANIMSSPYKVLELNELVMVRLRIYTRQLTDPKSDFFESITMYYISFNMLAFIATSVAFVYQNVSNFMVVLRTLMVIVGTSQALGMFLYIGRKIIKVKMLHQKLQAIVDRTARGSTLFFQRFSIFQRIFLSSVFGFLCI